MKTRVWVKQNRLPEALGWARERGLSVDDDLSYLQEFEHITLARVLIAQYKNDREHRSILEAMELLERLLKAAEDGRRMGNVIEILVLQALAHEKQDNIRFFCHGNSFLLNIFSRSRPHQAYVCITMRIIEFQFNFILLTCFQLHVLKSLIGMMDI